MEWRSLPGDLVEDILSRVTAIPLARLRRTSKQWNAVLKSGSLAKMHTAKAPKEESLIITLIDFRVCLLRIDLHAPSVRVANQLYLKDPLSNSQVDIRNVFHCDGLLLCTTKDKRLVLWNPCSGETTWIKPRDSYKKTDYYALGYDYNSSCKQYKILRVDRHRDIPVNNEYEIYDFTSNSWRVLGAATDWFLALYCHGVSFKGNTYWVATQAGNPHTDFLLSFDFSTEMFRSLSLPRPNPYSISALSVVGEEKLCLLCTKDDYPEGLQVWVTPSTDSWSKLPEVIANNQIYKCQFTNGMSFLADEQNKVVMCLNTNDDLHIMRENKLILTKLLGGGKRKSIKHVTCKFSSVLLNYAPSLAKIQQGTLPGHGGRKRKSPSM